jgi:predicted metalloprotease
MHREVVDGPYRIVVNADRKFDPLDPAHVVGYTVRAMVDRIDRRPVQGSMLTERSDEMVPLHGDHFLTVDAALEHGEAWGRHCIAQWRGSNRH